MDCPKCQAANPDTQVFCGQCGTSLRPAAPPTDDVTQPSPEPRDELESGTMFAGRYQIVEELGRGGMGRVYKVIDKEIHAKIALKLIRPEIAADRATIDRFRHELKTAREISHRNICRMYDLGRDGSTYFLTMEYVSGQDLKSMIAMTGQLGVGTALSIAKQVCDGLAEAHRAGIVHRDLKPQNIQIDKGGHAKIMDFGIARSVMANGLTDAGVVIGTPQYMSPEQVDGKEVDARSDLYSLGIILYEMLTGRVPFEGDTPLSVAVKQKIERPRDPRELNAAIPPDLDGVVLKCLEKDKGQRYQGAAELHADLERIEQGLPTTEQVVPQQRPATSKQITVQFTWKQLLVPALAVVAVAAIALGAWHFWPRRSSVVLPPGARPTLAVLYFENISGDQALNTWRTGLPDLLTTSLSQSRLVNVVSSENVFSTLKKLNLAEAKRYSAEDLGAIAREGNAQYLVTGGVMKAGQKTVITARLQNAATGEVVKSQTIECLKDEEILVKVDELAGVIKANLDLSPTALASDTSQPAAAVLTASPVALKYYTEAQRLHFQRQYPDAVALYQRAIDADSGFAMAYRGMAACYSNLGQPARRSEAVKRALALSDRLPERYRYQIQLTAYYASPATFPQVIEVGNKLLALFPNDTIALNYMGLVSCATWDFAKCAEYNEANVKAEPTRLLAVGNLASVYEQLGQYDKAMAAIERFLERDPNNTSARVMLAFDEMILGKFAEAVAEADRVILADPRNVSAVVLKGDVAHLRGDFAASEREYRSILDQPSEQDQRGAHVKLAKLYLTQGQFEKVREQMKAAMPPGARGGGDWATDLETGRYDAAIAALQSRLADPAASAFPTAAMNLRFALGVCYAAKNDLAKAQNALDDLYAVPEGVFGRAKSFQRLALSGVIAARRGDGKAAIADLEQARTVLPHQSTTSDSVAPLLYSLAEAYALTGDWVKARETYEQITSLTVGRLSWGTTYVRSFYQLGLIAEKQGDAARARENFTKFLELWKNADPGQPEVADARNRLK